MISIFTPGGTTIGRFVRVWEQIGVTTIAFMSGQRSDRRRKDCMRLSPWELRQSGHRSGSAKHTAVDAHLEFDHARQRAFVYDDIIQSTIAATCLPAA